MGKVAHAANGNLLNVKPSVHDKAAAQLALLVGAKQDRWQHRKPVTPDCVTLRLP